MEKHSRRSSLELATSERGQLSQFSCAKPAAGLSRESVISAHMLASAATRVATLWSDIAAGKWVLEDYFCTTTRCFGVFRATSTAERPKRQIPIQLLARLERALTGESQKSVAIDLGLSGSAIASCINEAKRRLGLRCRTAEVPLVLLVAVHAHCRGVAIEARTTSFHWGDTPFKVVSCARPDAMLVSPMSELTPSEAEVLRLFVEGRSCAEIARLRRRSPRTVANQLINGRRKLRAYGRLDLLGILARVEAQPPELGVVSVGT
jgi:DNA-binding CsgD family transcriptional regulator